MEEVLKRIHQRNDCLVQKVYPLADLICTLSKESALVNVLRKEKQSWEQSKSRANEDAQEQFQEKITSLEEELRNAYKTQSEQAKEQLKMSKDMRSLQEQQKTDRNALETCKQERDHARQERSDAFERIEDQNVTLSVLRDELQALQLEMVRIEARASTLAKENADLVSRWLKKVTSDAQKMNQANQMVQEALSVQKASSLAERASKRMSSPAHLTMSSSTPLLPGHVSRTIQVTQGEANVVTFSRTGALVGVGCTDKTVKVYDTQTGACRFTVTGTNSMMDVDFSANGKLFMGASADFSTRIWSLSHGRLVFSLTGHIGRVVACRFTRCGTKALTGSHDRTVKVWDMERGYCIRTILCYSTCNDVEPSLDGSMCYSAHLDGSLRIWDVRTGNMAQEKKLHPKPITSLSLANDGYHLLAASRDHTLSYVALPHGLVDATLSDATGRYKSAVGWHKASLSPDGYYVAAGSAEGAVVIWDIAKQEIVERKMGGHKTPVTAVSWSPWGLASTDRSGKMCLWN